MRGYFTGYRVKAKFKIIFYMTLKKITKRKMILDITGTLLTPGNCGIYCKGNGNHVNWRGKLIECCCDECCCDECDYMMCCLEEPIPNGCLYCTNIDCLHSSK